MDLDLFLEGSHTSYSSLEFLLHVDQIHVRCHITERAGKDHHTSAFFSGNDTGANCPYPEGISGTGVPLGAQGTGKAPGNFRSVTGFRSIWEVFNDIAAGVSKISRKLQVSNP